MNNSYKTSKYCVGILLCMFVAIVISGCATSKIEEGNNRINWNAVSTSEGYINLEKINIKRGTFNIMAGFQIDNGIATVVSDKDVNISSFLSANYIKNNGFRITQIYKNAAELPISHKATVKRKLLDSSKFMDKNIDLSKVDEFVKDKYGLKASGNTYFDKKDDRKIKIPNKYKYSAILFVPKYRQVQIKYEEHNMGLAYPNIGVDGSVEGFYLLIEGSNPNKMLA